MTVRTGVGVGINTKTKSIKSYKDMLKESSHSGKGGVGFKFGISYTSETINLNNE